MASYKIPDGWGGLKEVEFIWDGVPNEDLERVTMRVRKMPLKKVEEMLVDFIYLQLKDKILVVSKEQTTQDKHSKRTI